MIDFPPDACDPGLGIIGEYANTMLRGFGRRFLQLLDAITPDGYGTHDIDGFRAKWDAYKLDRQLKATYDRLGLGNELGTISEAQVRSFLTDAARVPGFTQTYGTTEQILQRVDEKYQRGLIK